MSLAEQVLAGIKGRGLKLRLYEPNELVLVAKKGQSSEATAALIEVVKEFKDELIELEQLKPAPKPEKPKIIRPYQDFLILPVPGQTEPDRPPPNNAIETKIPDEVPDGKPIYFRYRQGDSGLSEPSLWSWSGAKSWYPWEESKNG